MHFLAAFSDRMHGAVLALGAVLAMWAVAGPGGSAAIAAPPVVNDPRSLPLDFSYRVQGGGPAIGVVFDDGRDVFLQPVRPLQAASLRADGFAHAVQGPYLVIRGLANRIEVTAGSTSGSTVVEYRGKTREETAVRECVPGAGDEQRATIPFGSGALQTEPGGLDHLAKVIAMARGSDRVTIVSQGDRPQSPIALRRAARVRELLVASGVAPALIVEQVRRAADSTVHVVALRAGTGCVRHRMVDPVRAHPHPSPPLPDVPGTVNRAGHAVPAVGPSSADRPGIDAPVAASSPLVRRSDEGSPSSPAVDSPPADLRLTFHPNSSVQATLRSYLRAHGMAVEFKGMPVLMVEEFAQVSGADLREVLRQALSRLGLRGEIQGNQLLVVELAR